MSHPQGKFIGPGSFGQTEILFLQSPGRVGVLVSSKGKRKQKTMQFKNGQAAIQWCDAHRVMMLYFPAADPAAN
jgi:hypothetical protein